MHKRPKIQFPSDKHFILILCESLFTKRNE